jgi:glycosyltransferase involved in cell wall biosynthesis
MKILHINSYYSGSKFYKNLYDYQVKNGLDISVFVPVSSSINDRKDFGSYTTISKNHSKYDRIIFHLKQHKIYKDITNKYDVKKFSIIHAHSLFTNGYIAMNLNKGFGIPYIVAVRNTDVNIFFKKMFHLRRVGVEILKNADRVIFLSETYKDEVVQGYVPEKYRKEINNKSLIVPNGIDDYWFENIVSQKKEPSNTNLRLLQIGDINRNKNIETTVKSVELLGEKGYKVSLDVVGKIKDQTVFEKIKDLDFVNYLGIKTKEELLEIYRNNDIFILPSINETFGLVYAEAMSQGLPLIYSRGQGFDCQFPEGEVGFSVNCFNELEISNRIIDIKTGFKKISNNCIILCEKFKWENVASEYSNIYFNVVSISGGER